MPLIIPLRYSLPKNTATLKSQSKVIEGGSI